MKTKEALMKRQVKLRPSPAITNEQSDAEDVEEVRGIWREKVRYLFQLPYLH
ncbi:MAG: hypothetical protein LUD70_16870 [Bacteroides ovatus]|uniref:hypothetical protein n=1 Tax=Bacteroides sp. TaxID=29523 RepID=UPI003AB8E039|nr:hypothetical protein [Bacteroides ovatus]